jgi:hypothetical protein
MTRLVIVLQISSAVAAFGVGCGQLCVTDNGMLAMWGNPLDYQAHRTAVERGQANAVRDLRDRAGPVTNWAGKRVRNEHTDTVLAGTAVGKVALIIAGASIVRRTALRGVSS